MALGRAVRGAIASGAGVDLPGVDFTVVDHSLSVYVRKLNVVIFFAIILQNTFKIS